MRQVGVQEAKTQLSRLLREVAAGSEIVIVRSGVPIAKLIQLRPPATRRLGCDRGIFEVPDDFDAPLPDDVADGFGR